MIVLDISLKKFQSKLYMLCLKLHFPNDKYGPLLWHSNQAFDVPIIFAVNLQPNKTTYCITFDKIGQHALDKYVVNYQPNKATQVIC